MLEEISEMLEKMDIEVIHFHSESTYDQLEIVTAPAAALKACDNLLLTRLAIGILRGTVARRKPCSVSS